MTTPICPQAGPQEAALRSAAAVVVQGGARGGAKSFTLLMKAARWVGVKGFNAVLFRETEDEVYAQGGLWEKSYEVYPHLGGVPLKTEGTWQFPSGATVTMGYFAGDRGLSKWLGQQICFIGVDEAANWREPWIWLLLSSNRSTCGVKPRMHLTLNPDPDCFMRSFLDWWIAPDGYADLSRSGRCRWFCRHKGELRWADTRRELLQAYPSATPLSATFFLSALAHNQILLRKDPTYRAKLEALPEVERARFLGDVTRGGNWNVRHSAGTVFRSSWFPLIIAGPGAARRIRSWDLAWTPTGCWTVGTLLAETGHGWVVEDQIALRAHPDRVRRTLAEVAVVDTPQVAIRLPNDGASSFEIDKLVAELTPLTHLVHVQRELGTIEARSITLRTQAERGLVALAATHPSKGIAQQLAADGIETSTAVDWRSNFAAALDRFPNKPDDHIASFVGGFTSFNEIGVPLSEGVAEAFVAGNPALVGRTPLVGRHVAEPGRLLSGRFRVN